MRYTTHLTATGEGKRQRVCLRQHGERRDPQRAIAGRRQLSDRRLLLEERSREWELQLAQVLERSIEQANRSEVVINRLRFTHIADKGASKIWLLIGVYVVGFRKPRRPRHPTYDYAAKGQVYGNRLFCRGARNCGDDVVKRVRYSLNMGGLFHNDREKALQQGFQFLWVVFSAIIWVNGFHWWMRLFLSFYYGYEVVAEQDLFIDLPSKGSGIPSKVSNGDALIDEQRFLFTLGTFVLLAGLGTAGLTHEI